MKTITLTFDETPSLVGKTATLTKGEESLTAAIAAGEGNTFEITLDDTLKVNGTYTLTIPAGTFGDADFAANPAIGHCNPELTRTYTVKAPVVKDLEPSDITPDNGAEVPALKTITLTFDETPYLVGKTATLTKGEESLTAAIAAGEGNTFEITLDDTLKVNGTYTLTIPAGTFGDADFAADPTTGHCNPELVYTYTIKAPEPVKPDEPDKPSSITETQQDAGHITVYNLQGVPVLETNDAADLRKLSAGFYIVNGKKMVVTR